jgi:TRAP-type uncharacterized transport system substrate-binding protein
LGNVISRRSELNVTVEPVGRSDADVRALMAKRMAFDLINSLVSRHASWGIGSFAKKEGATGGFA